MAKPDLQRRLRCRIRKNHKQAGTGLRPGAIVTAPSKASGRTKVFDVARNEKAAGAASQLCLVRVG